MSPYSKDLNKL
jgi:serine/threonine protein kinase